MTGKYHKRTAFIFITYFLCTLCFAQVVKTPFPIKSLSWSKNDEAFSLSEGDNIFLRDSNTYELLDSLNVKDVAQFTFSTEGKKQVLLTVSKSGLFSVYNLADIDGKLRLVSDKPYFSRELSGRQEVTQVAFSQNSDFIALALKDNTIDLFFKLRISRQAYKNKLTGHWSDVCNLGFSKDSKYLASTAKDGTVIVWDCGTLNQKMIIKNIFMKNKVPAVFAGSSKLICCHNETSFTVYNLDGEEQLTINTLHPIKKIKPMLNSRYISLLSDKNEIEIYDIIDNKWIGYIPQCSAAPVTDYEFNSDCHYILIGAEDGCVYKFVLYEVLLHPNEKPKVILKPTTQVNKSNSPRAVIEGRNSFIISAGAAYLQNPFVFGLNLDAQFRYRKNLEPFFTGIGLEGQLGFSKKEETKKFQFNGENFKDLNILSGTLYIPFGVQFSPKSNDFNLLFIGKGGFRIAELALLSNSRYIISDYETTYFVSGGAGFVYKFFETTLNLEYDGIGKLSPTLYAGFNFRMG